MEFAQNPNGSNLLDRWLSALRLRKLSTAGSGATCLISLRGNVSRQFRLALRIDGPDCLKHRCDSLPMAGTVLSR